MVRCFELTWKLRFTNIPAILISDKNRNPNLTNFCHLLMKDHYVLVIETDIPGNLAQVTPLYPNSSLLLYLLCTH